MSTDPLRPLQWVSLSLQSRDAYRAITIVALAGLVAALAMATLGLPPVDLHGPLHHLGIMMPTCGATRAARLAARGELGAAWTYNPLGIAADLAALLGTARGAVGLATGRWLTWSVGWTRPRRGVVLAVALLLLAILEVRQQLRADLLMGPR